MFKKIIAAFSLALMASSVSANDGQGGASFDPGAYSGDPPIPERKPDLRTVTITYCSGLCDDPPKSRPTQPAKEETDQNGGNDEGRGKIVDVAVDVVLGFLNKGCIGGGCKYADEAYEKGKQYSHDNQAKRNGDEKTEKMINECLNSGKC